MHAIHKDLQRNQCSWLQKYCKHAVKSAVFIGVRIV